MTGALCLWAHLVAAAVVDKGLGSDDDWCALLAPCALTLLPLQWWRMG